MAVNISEGVEPAATDKIETLLILERVWAVFWLAYLIKLPRCCISGLINLFHEIKTATMLQFAKSCNFMACFKS